jgi:D-alanine transaminase
MISYFNGQFLQQSDISISPEDRGFLMGDGVYEVIRSYHGHLFELDAHIERLGNGASALLFNRTAFNELKEVASQLIIQNDLCRADATVYIQVTRGAASRSHQFPPSDTPLTIYATSQNFTRIQSDKGISATLCTDSRWERCNIKSINLVVNSMAHQHAIEAGTQEAIFIRNGYLTEGAHTNVLMVKNKSIITPPATNFILDGITRNVVLSLCRIHNIPVHECSVTEQELFDADELMVVGTTVEIAPVIMLNNQPVNEGKPGPFTIKLQRLFHELIGQYKPKHIDFKANVLNG